MVRILDIARELDRALKEIPLTPVDFGRKLKAREDSRKASTGNGSPKPLPITRLSPESFIPEAVATPTKSAPTPEPSSSPALPATSMDSSEALRTVINDPRIKLTPDMMNLVNDDSLVVLPSGEVAQRLSTSSFDLARAEKKKKPKTSKYSRTYRANFRRLAPKYKLANGKWKKDGFKSAVKAAHKETRKALGL